MTCPHCHGVMTAETLEGHLGTSVAIDLCLPCQVFWFDGHESLQLSPGGVLNLFRTIGERTPGPAGPPSSHAVCPRCRALLQLTHDQQRNTRFQYLRCPKDHGRLITFVEFLREKDFVRPLSAGQIQELRQNVQVITCSSCGAPIDLAAHDACTHCGAPLSMLDFNHAGALVVQLQEAERTDKTIDPALPLRLERARREVETAFASFDRGQGWFDDVSSGGLVGAGLSALAKWLKSGASG